MLRARLLRLRPLARAPAAARFHVKAPLSKEVTVTVDGVQVQIENGLSIIQAADKAGVVIPRYCYHEKLAIAGNCRMCLVEVEKLPKLAAACAFPVRDGMVVHTTLDRIKEVREDVTEMLLENHPLDCPVCDQGGECDLQEQTLRYGRDRGRFTEVVGKRAVENKAFGPLVKTLMNRCIHCTRCVRFLNDVAGAPELGTSGRGNDMQIGTYVTRNINSELSGNVIDLCPVGALTLKPYAFRARPWELKRTETVDVMDGLGLAIRVDTRGIEVMRVLPRLNDDVNEEWISDKTRFACDALKLQRLTTPLIKVGSSFQTADWDSALKRIAQVFEEKQPKANEFKAVSGALADVESQVALRDLAHALGLENLVQDVEPATDATFRSNYSFNSTILGIEDADQILLVGTNPRLEAAVLNARIRKVWLRLNLEIHHVGEPFEGTFDVNHVGTSAADLEKSLRGEVGKKLASAKKPLIIVGSGVVEGALGANVLKNVADFCKKHASVFNTPDWNGFNVLQRSAARAGALDVGFFAPESAKKTEAKIVYLLNADEFDPASIPKDAFVVYQGHHGDVGASYADVILPGSAYTEKTSTYVNTEGRAQSTRAATNAPGVAREDWKIIRALSEYLGAALPYEDGYQMRARLAQIAPHLVRHDVVESSSVEIAALGLQDLVNKDGTGAELKNPIENFYFTDVISRNSPTMAKCVLKFGALIEKEVDLNPEVAII